MRDLALSAHRRSTEASSLEWVVVDGVPRHVSVFATVPPRRRPPAFCPNCARQITLKLGSVRRHHAAHQPAQICAATRPETALHINCKLALAAALSDARGTRAAISLVRRCAATLGNADACDETRVVEWISAWDDVQVEHRIGNARRPDILLLREGVAIGGVEILVSHEVSPDKATVLAELGVPWIEVVATEELATVGGWTPAEPLIVLHTSDEREWRCAAHAAAHGALLDARDATRLAEREAARHSVTLVAARVVDVYHAGGARERLIYRVSELSTDGRAHTLRLQRGGIELAAVELATSADRRRDAWPTLRSAFDADLVRAKRDDRSFEDSPMRWARGDAAENIVDEALADRVGRDPTPLATRFPRRWFYAAEQERWFLPGDMRAVRWDRGPAGAFAPHAAWSRGRSSVREHPAPEGSWTTPVFASRPVAAMFGHAARTVAIGAPGGSMTIVELNAIPADARRAIIVVERATADAAIASLATSLHAEGVDAIWMSHPSDWTPALALLAWVAAGRDSRGRGCVVVDGLGIFRAERFARAVASGDARVTPAAIRWRMAARVARLFATLRTSR